MTSIPLGRIDSTIDDGLALLQRDLETLAGVDSPRLSFEVNLTVHTPMGDSYPLGVKVRRSENPDGRPYIFETSHRARTPDQISAYAPSAPIDNSVAGAIHAAIESVRSYVDRAVRNGHSFDPKWLVPNPRY
jgi:hypothetical protein